ncbi:MAG: hypothetical protein IPJ36_05580 [Simplicispira sp.]|nr:hypothetical protein [Simplicispira sp.]
MQVQHAVRKDADIAAHYGGSAVDRGRPRSRSGVWRERSARSNADNETLRETLKRLGVQP